MVFLNAAAQGAGGGMGSTIIMFVAIIAIMYFMMIRPQRKQQKKIDTFRKGLQVGQEVVTSGGLYGKIKSIENGIVMLEVAHNVVMRVDISVIYPNPAEIQEGK
ncbi:MAG: preprotein translocase subunit YajC [Bacteroidaceae bacterium]|nr:preprotein translocase subunit YajC [Bacteroidaceae bacterium]